MKLRDLIYPLLLAITIALLVAVVLLLLAFGLSGCHDPLVEYVKRQYPNCEVLKIEDTSFGDQEVTLQCPMSAPKTIRLKQRK